MGAMQQSMIMASGSSFTPVTRIYSTAVGTTTETAPAGATNVIIAVWGAGGGGSRGITIMCLPEPGFGGGAGGYSESSYAISGGQTLQYVVGAGGAGGASGQASGLPGAASSVISGTKTITTMTANGGAGGTYLAGVAGGTASGGTTQNTTGGSSSDDLGGSAVVGWNGNSDGNGGQSRVGVNGTPGDSGQVIFYYT